ncbi:MAG: ATP-dependent DNA helicase RecG [Olegusella sp.]|nr:ATP-dependent DNA helicase RecG [Olegusella sp.]
MGPATFCVGEAAGRLTRTVSFAGDVGRLRFASRFTRASGGKDSPLARLGITRTRDLLLHVPSHYTDYTQVVTVEQAEVGQIATLIARIDKIDAKRPKPRLHILEVFVTDGTGVLKVTFFRQPWLEDQLAVGDTLAVSGKVTFSYGFKQITPTFWEKLELGEDGVAAARIMPTYPLTEGISLGWMRRLVSAALADVGDVADFLPAGLVARRGLPGLAQALREVHFPLSLEAAEQARRRLAYDELLCLQLTLLTRRRLTDGGVTPTRHVTDGPHMAALRAALPFSLSAEQEVAVAEVLADMAAPQVMNRLLLGDVGTGKTVVAALAIAACADTGTQAAMMAPTSVLARQYAEKVGPLLEEAGIECATVTGATPPEERAEIRERVASGQTTVVFGTTALLSDDIEFSRLTLVVVDEQHRFGVEQRTALRRKGPGADLLAMTATPIPRTLALALYGDMDCSRISHRPVAGAGITTKSLAPENLDMALGSIREALATGQQAYVVCPLVDDADPGADLDDVPESARSAAAHLHSVASTLPEIARLLPEARVAALTGRMSAAEKGRAMEDFRAGATDVLVCTTVVEVGVDVPNATVMLVYDADRFGLATLHQLRGRVGRGSVTGTVWLLCAAKKNTPARRRLDALEATSDGFELAELDLKLRREGEVLGYRQSGGVSLKISDLAGDADLVAQAHDDALYITHEDPDLSRADHVPLALEVRDRFGAYFEEVERV